MTKSKGLCNHQFPTEAEKIKPIIMPYLKDKAVIYDVGCGRQKIVPHAFGIDIAKNSHIDIHLPDRNAVYELTKYVDKRGDVVFSSHFLEHVNYWEQALFSMIRILKTGGILVLYLPDDNYYDNDSNPQHLHRFTYEQFSNYMLFVATNLELIESGFHTGIGLYSFYWIGYKK